ncbi:MAG: hypothetical protein J2P41_03025 [Blastocatellia bacterium]|nr:hypothetical protein [Blastocatellia bacterium]
MSITRNIILAAAVVSIIAGSAFAQSSTSTRTTRRWGTINTTRTNDNGQITIDKSATGANGRTATAQKTIDANASDGTLGRTRTVTGPQGRTRITSGNATFGNGSLSTSRTDTGRGGRTSTRQATRNAAGVAVTRTNRAGQVFSRSRSRR